MPKKQADKEEQDFQTGIKKTEWFKEYVKEYGEEPDLNTKDYDYRSAWKAGVRPQRDPYDKNRYHWSSSNPETGEMLKSKEHPTAWKEEYMKRTGKNPDEAGITKEQAGMAKGGQVKAQTKKLLEEGGMLQEGGTVDEESGNAVPVGAMKEEVRDDIPAKLSEGEFVFPADVVRYIGLERLMMMRQAAKEGLKKMEAMGQMSNAEEATEEDDGEFESELDDIMEEIESEEGEDEGKEEETEMAVGGMAMDQQPAVPEGMTQEAAAPKTPQLTPEQMDYINKTAENMKAKESELADIEQSTPTEGLKPSDIIKSNFPAEQQDKADEFIAKVERLNRAQRLISTRYNDTVILGFVKRPGVVDPYFFSNDPPEKLDKAIQAGIEIAKKAGIKRFESNQKNNISALENLGYDVQQTENGWSLDIA